MSKNKTILDNQVKNKTINISEELHTLLKVMASEKQMTIRELLIEILNEVL